MTVVARIGIDPARPERLTMWHVSPIGWIDGTVSNRFATHDTRETIAAALAACGMTLQANDTVTREES
jgi:hypothetical protein